MNTKALLLATLGIALCVVRPSSAAVNYGDALYIDFGRNDTTNGIIMPSAGTMNPGAGNSTGVVDTYGHYWNNAWMNTANVGGNTPASLVNLVTSTNVGTGLGLSFSNNWQSNGFNNGGLLAPSFSLLGDFASKNATGDYFFHNSADSGAFASMTFSGLDPSLKYDFQIFATRLATSGTDTRTSQYSITDVNGFHSINLQTTGTGIGAGGYNGNNNTFVTLSGIVADGLGNVTLSIKNPTGGFSYIGALKVTAVPEPGAGGIAAAVGCLAMVFYRRRQRASRTSATLGK